MIGNVEAAFVDALGAAATFPVRWANDPWPDGVNTSDGNMPVNGDGLPAPAIEAELISGRDETMPAGKNAEGKRTHRLPGIVRLYLSVGQGTGRSAINVEVDALLSAFDRATLIDNYANGETLRTEDPRVDNDVAAYEEGNRFVRMVSVPWMYLYQTVQK
ncbi:hypothetical protein E6C67_08410 [Azospirillum sp. TSA2s]|uniref:hypothetical protein n=1 Tax=Azospirillum sp. TSA2s TaxID=709810 RepID=UPI0010AB1492|nr:hypothetical protein [Azospirillum sp. TSA2s]QCG93961.1 hypothetical protein E6C67_08410 [Azospirillum sp. TSA2s]